MEQHIFWQPWSEIGLEHLHIQHDTDGLIADGLIVRHTDSRPFRLHYVIRCDNQIRVRDVALHILGQPHTEVVLHADGQGHWIDAAGNPVPLLDGCIDVDIAVTPFTNTLPIKRLALSPGASSEIDVVYFTALDVGVTSLKQRYTCITQNVNSAIYRYQSIGSGFTADLLVDQDDLVVDYPDLFRRV